VDPVLSLVGQVTPQHRRRLVQRKNRIMRIVYVLGISIAGVSGMFAVSGHGQTDTTSSAGPKTEAVEDAAGNLRVPNAYRTTYQVLGSWAIAADQGQGSKDLHVVYASPGTISAYRRDGRFPDGAVLVKEVFRAATEEMTTGTVSHAGTLKGWFVMVKDSNGRHAGNKLWGDGWGWSWFDAANPSKTTSTDYKADCQSCHVPAQGSDWVYVSGYPPLKR
jgi:Cytochrome P460